MIEPASTPIEILFALVGLIAVTVFFAIRGKEERQALFVIAICAYLVKAFLVPVYYWFLTEIGAQGFAYWDSHGYHNSAKAMAFEIANNLPHDARGWKAKDPGYSVLCALLYAVFGSSTLIARLYNSVVATFTLLYVYRIAILSFDKNVAKIAVRIMAFLPFSLLVTINHRKEPTVIFLATILFYHAMRFLAKVPKRLTSIPIILAGVALMFYFRSGFVLIFLGMFLVTYILTQRSIGEGMLVSLFVMGALIASQLLFPEVKQLDIQGNIEAKVAEQVTTVQFRGGLLRNAMVTSMFDIWKAPIAAALMLVMPFPPQYSRVETSYDTLLEVAHLVFLLFLPQLVLGVREVFRADVWKRRLPVLVFASGFLLLIAALSVGVLRYRETVFPLIAILTAAGFRVRQKLFLTGGVYFGLFFLAVAVYTHRFLR